MQQVDVDVVSMVPDTFFSTAPESRSVHCMTSCLCQNLRNLRKLSKNFQTVLQDFENLTKI